LSNKNLFKQKEPDGNQEHVLQAAEELNWHPVEYSNGNYTGLSWAF